MQPLNSQGPHPDCRRLCTAHFSSTSVQSQQFPLACVSITHRWGFTQPLPNSLLQPQSSEQQGTLAIQTPPAPLLRPAAPAGVVYTTATAPQHLLCYDDSQRHLQQSGPPQRKGIRHRPK